MPMKIIYDLRDDRCAIESFQRSGFKMAGGLVGSDEWWENIHCGQIPVQVIEGKINQIWSGRESDEPEFGVVDVNGECFQWLYPSWGQEVPHSPEFELNGQVEVSYVEKRLDVPIGGKLIDPILLRIRIKTHWAVIF